MTVFTLIFLCVLGIFGALQVPGTSATWQDSSAVSSKDQEVIVNLHNYLRRNVDPRARNMLKMSWNSEAAANAEEWANTCSMEHSSFANRVISTSNCGENLFMSSIKLNWGKAIYAWYNEVNNWAYGQGSVNGGVVGHFTQVVWYKSREIGCAMAHCPDAAFQYFYVCQYCPPGNIQFTHPYTTGDNCGDCPDACDEDLCTNPCLYTDQYSNCGTLVENWGCGTFGNKCPATCKCTTEIQ